MVIDFLQSLANASWHLFLAMSPYLLLGFLFAGILYAFIPANLVARYMGGESIGSVIRASLAGIPLPLCSCGVLPVAASARKSGAGKAPTLSFLITTPVTGVDSIIATAGLLGIVFTIARIIVSFILGIIAGIISIFSSGKNPALENIACVCDNCDLPVPGKGFGAKVRKATFYIFSELPESLFGSILIGILVGGLITVLVPEHLINDYVGTGLIGIIMAVLIGIPLYVCATGSIPIAVVLMLKGFSPGAALAFLIAGPATNMVAITTVRKILGNRFLFIYLLTILAGAILFGLLFDLLPFSYNLKPAMIAHNISHHSLIYQLSAFMLVFIFGFGKIRALIKERKFKEMEKIKDNKNVILLNVPDMTCSHCEQVIKNALTKLDFVESVAIDLKNKKVSVSTKPVFDIKRIIDALNSIGYSAVPIKK